MLSVGSYASFVFCDTMHAGNYKGGSHHRPDNIYCASANQGNLGSYVFEVRHSTHVTGEQKIEDAQINGLYIYYVSYTINIPLELFLAFQKPTTNDNIRSFL